MNGIHDIEVASIIESHIVLIQQYICPVIVHSSKLLHYGYFGRFIGGNNRNPD